MSKTIIEQDAEEKNVKALLDFISSTIQLVDTQHLSKGFLREVLGLDELEEFDKCYNKDQKE